VDSKAAQVGSIEEEEGGLVRYYDQLADRYDTERFGNSYGRYVDAQERRLLRNWLAPCQRAQILDLACGTGRLLDLASHGLDASPAMVRIARQKYPHRIIHCAPARNMAEFGVSFDAILCLHLFMHLSPAEIAALVQTSFDQLRSGGLLIFDVPSAHRRRLTRFRPAGWHAGTALTPREVEALAGPRWRFLARHGILFFPVHRLPEILRPLVRPLDDLAGATLLKSHCSYQLYCLQRCQ
jgi:SAM-dependent methyltransferase